MRVKGTVSFPGPFDDSALDKQLRMGLIGENGGPNAEALAVLGRVYAGLFYESLSDAGNDMEKVFDICEHIIETVKKEDIKQALLAICVQYDAIIRPLPEPLWWIVGNQELTGPFVRAFAKSLDGFLRPAGNGVDKAL